MAVLFTVGILLSQTCDREIGVVLMFVITVTLGSLAIIDILGSFMAAIKSAGTIQNGGI